VENHCFLPIRYNLNEPYHGSNGYCPSGWYYCGQDKYLLYMGKVQKKIAPGIYDIFLKFLVHVDGMQKFCYAPITEAHLFTKVP